MKTNIKMRVTPEQLEKICKIVGEGWLYFKSAIYMYIFNDGSIEVSYSKENWNKYNLQEIDADLFIRTDGTCEETFKDKADLYFKQADDYYKKADDYYKKVEDSITNLIIVELQNKLKKKNEILKKARIKRKNQREELQKLNLKLQKCISLEEHDSRIKTVLNEKHNLKAENIEMGKLVNLNRSALDLAVMTKDLAMKEIEELNKQIEKLKAVIEYLESKVK